MKMPPALSVAVWLSAFLSPTAYFLLILLAAKSNAPNLPETLVWTLFILVPASALFICEWVAWSCSMTFGRKIGWMLFTLLAILLQFAIILAILRMILVVAIGYAQ